MSDEIKVGATINSKYELMSVIGKGRKATVYKGYQHFAKKSAAVKILDAQAKISADDLKRFQKETKFLTSLHAHKGIVNLLDFGAAGIGQAYLVTELIEGPTLRQLLDERTSLDATTAQSIFGQVIEALAFVHEKNIVHASLNPTEILLTPAAKGAGYATTVIDFGSAKSLEEPGETLKVDPGAEPSPYASPELAGCKSFDARTDIYSVGCMLYEALVGKLPESNPPTFATDTTVPQPLQEVIVKALNPDPAKRFASMKEMAAAMPRGSSAPSDEKKDLWGSIKGMFK
ncbi:MAG: serine/threonine-protein kinase [Candidatus Melainabacteria bacterium]|nr:serine/threonine-protein kinase [Candidatus Melainabacteria bacterium]